MTEIKRTPDGIEIPPPGPGDVLYEPRDGYAIITLNRPVVLNAINKNLLRLLDSALDKAESDGDVKAVILTGAGRAFCAGGDLYSSLYPDDEPAPSGLDVQMRIFDFAKPVIAAVRGHAVGQGCELAGVCDFTIASDDARFGEIQIRHGFGPPVLITPFLVGLKNAKELLLLGDQIDAHEAQRMGLVNKVVPRDQLLEEAFSIVERIALVQPGIDARCAQVRIVEIIGHARTDDHIGAGRSCSCRGQYRETGQGKLFAHPIRYPPPRPSRRSRVAPARPR